MKRKYFLFALLVLLVVSCNKSKDSPADNNSTINYNDNSSTTPVDTYVFNNELVWGY